jgi:hypothetical protein
MLKVVDRALFVAANTNQQEKHPGATGLGDLADGNPLRRRGLTGVVLDTQFAIQQDAAMTDVGAFWISTAVGLCPDPARKCLEHDFLQIALPFVGPQVSSA